MNVRPFKTSSNSCFSRHCKMAARISALALFALVYSAPDLSSQENEYYARQAFVRKVSLEIDSDLKGFKEEPFIEKTKLDPVEDRWKRLGFIPFAREYGRSVYPNTIPEQAERGGALVAFAAPGEVEPLAFGLRTLDLPLSGIRLICDGLKNIDTTGNIPSEAIDLSVVEYWRVRWGEGSSARKWRWSPTRIWPMAGFPGDPFCRPDTAGVLTIAAGSARCFWLTIHTPRNATPGLYTGEVVLGADMGAYRFPVEFTVLPVPLDQASGLTAGVMMSGPQDAAACRDLAEHGVSGTSQWYDPTVLPPVRGRGFLTFDYTLQDAYMRRLAGAGVKGPHLFVRRFVLSPRFDNAVASAVGIAQDSAGYFQAYAPAVQDLFEHARKNNWPSLIWGILDRPAPEDGGDEWFISRAAELRRITPLGGVRLVSPILGDAGNMQELDLLGGLLAGRWEDSFPRPGLGTCSLGFRLLHPTRQRLGGALARRVRTVAAQPGRRVYLGLELGWRGQSME